MAIHTDEDQPVIPPLSSQQQRSNLRPKSAGACPATNRKPLLLHGPNSNCNHHSQIGSHARYVGSSRPRPPSAGASAFLTNSFSPNGRPHRIRPRTETQTQEIVHSKPLRSRLISERVLKEEIEAQRQMTHEAQQEVLVLQTTLAQRQHEIELVQKHLHALENGLATSIPISRPLSPLASVTTKKISTTLQVTSTSIATHQTNQPNDSSLSLSNAITRLKDEIQRQELYKKKLNHLLDRLTRDVHFLTAQLTLLQDKHASAIREKAFFQTKLVQERNLCSELTRQKQELEAARVAFKRNTQLVLDSLTHEVASRMKMTQQRSEADRRRQDMLRLLESRPLGSVVVQSQRSSTSNRMPATNNHFSQGENSGGIVRCTSSLSRQFRRNSMDVQNLQNREAYFQRYEAQYTQIIEETHETDLHVVLERFVRYDAAMNELLQIEREMSESNARLERERQTHETLVSKLRVSGTAEVEKRRRIRDFLEDTHDTNRILKSQAKEQIEEFIKTFSYVQQGIWNIMELLKCLDDRVRSPTAQSFATLPSNGAAAVTTASAAATASLLMLQLIQSCQHIARQNPQPPIVFTTTQVEKLIAFVPEYQRDGHLVRNWRSLVPASSLTDTGGGSRGDEYDIYQTAIHSHDTDLNQSMENLTDDDTSDYEDRQEEDDETEDSRQLIKSNEREILRQVEALLHTYDAKQKLEAIKAKRADATLMKTSSERLLTCKARVNTQELLVPEIKYDKQARLNTVHQFFKEKRRRDRMDQQQQQRRLLFSASDAAAHVNHKPTASTSQNNVSVLPSKPQSIKVATVSPAQVVVSTATVKNSATGVRRSSNGVSFMPGFFDLQKQAQPQQQQVTTRKPSIPSRKQSV